MEKMVRNSQGKVGSSSNGSLPSEKTTNLTTLSDEVLLAEWGKTRRDITTGPEFYSPRLVSRALCGWDARQESHGGQAGATIGGDSWFTSSLNIAICVGEKSDSKTALTFLLTLAGSREEKSTRPFGFASAA